jgi:hypothetical protein
MAFFGGDDGVKMPSRSDLMSLSTINKKADAVKVTTSKFTTMRGASNNLTTNDISGKKLKIVVSNFVTYRRLTQTSWFEANCQA